MSDSTMSMPAQPGPEPTDDGAGGRVRRGGVVVAVVAAVVLVVVGGAGFAAWRFLGTSGTQPADALPADTLGLVSIDLDPSGGQKIQAIRALRSFPSFRDEVGLQEDDDVVARLFEELQKGDEEFCPGLDYARDVKPWIGQRFALAAVPGADEPEPVVMIQVADADAAQEGTKALAACRAEGGEKTGVAVGDDYLVVASSEKVAQGVVDDAAEESLGDDGAFQDWTGRAGDPGVLSLYAAPEAGQALAELGHGLAPAESEQLGDQLAQFEGAAATLRFEGGGLVLSGAAGGGQGEVTGGSVDDAVSGLPADTAALLAVGSSEESREQVRERLEQVEPGPTDDALGQVEGVFGSLGLEFPDDLLTVLGDTFSISVGGDAPASLGSPADVPAAIRVDGDPAAVEDVISRVEQQSGLSLQAQGVSVEKGDDALAVGFDAAYAKKVLAGDGGLGDDDVFGEVVPELSQASAVLFLRFDSAWRDRLLDQLPAGGPDRGDLESLQALGLSGWNDDGALRFEVRLALD